MAAPSGCLTIVISRIRRAKKFSEGFTRLKKVIPFIVLMVVLGLAVTGGVWSWRAEKRDRDDPVDAMREQKKLEAALAASVDRLVDKLALLRDEQLDVWRRAPGSPEFKAVTQELTEVQNLIAAEMPALVFYRDSKGNAVIVNVSMAREHLETIMKAAGDGAQVSR